MRRLLGAIIRKKNKKKNMVFKVDYENAYDSVHWDLLDEIMLKFGLGPKWRGSIMGCLKSSTGSVLVNDLMKCMNSNFIRVFVKVIH